MRVTERGVVDCRSILLKPNIQSELVRRDTIGKLEDKYLTGTYYWDYYDRHEDSIDSDTVIPINIMLLLRIRRRNTVTFLMKH